MSRRYECNKVNFASIIYILFSSMFFQNPSNLKKILTISFGLLFISSIPLMDMVFASTVTIPGLSIPKNLVIVDNLLYVSNEGTGEVSVIDVDPASASVNTIILTIPVADTINALRYVETATTKLLYVTDQAPMGNAVHVIELDSTNPSYHTVITSIPVGVSPFFLDYNPINKQIYVVNNFSNDVSIIDADPASPSFNTVVKTVPVGIIPVGVAVNQNTNTIYVANLFGNTISVIDGTTDTVVDSIDNVSPADIDIDPSNNNVIVGNIFASSVSVFDDTNNLIATIPTGVNPGNNAINTVTDLIFVPNTGSATLSIIDRNTLALLGAIPVEPSPFAVYVDEPNNLLYITHNGLDIVTIVDIGSNLPPTANAGPDQIVEEGSFVTLDGSGSSDFDGDPLTFLWSQIEGPLVTLSDPTSEMPTFDAPEVDIGTILEFQLVVNDGIFDSLPDSVIVVVTDTTTFNVPLTGTSEGIQGGITVESFPANNPLTFLIDSTVTFDNGALDQAKITSAVPGSDVQVDFSVRPDTPKIFNAKDNLENPALYFEINVGGLDLSDTNNIPQDNPAKPGFLVDKDYETDSEFSDGCPVVPFLRFNEKTRVWDQLGDPVLPNSNTLYVVDTIGDVILVIDANTNQIIETISGPELVNPGDTIVAKNANKVYVANGDGSVPVIDMTTNTIVTVIPSVQPGGFDPFDPTTEKVYLGSSGTGNINVIDTTTDRIVAEINTGGIFLSNFQPVPSLQRLFVADIALGLIFVIDTNTNSVINTITMPALSGDIHFNPKTNLLYLSLFTTNEVLVVDAITESIVDTIPVGIAPVGIRINESTNKVFVANAGSGTVSVIDANINAVIKTIEDPINLNPSLLGIEVNKNTDRVYVVNQATGQMTIIDGSQLTILDTVILQPGIFTIDANDSVPNPVRDPANDDGNQCAYIGFTDHLSKFAIGGIKALALGAFAGAVSDSGGSAPSLDNISFDGVTTSSDDGIIEFGGTIVDEIAPVNNLPTQTAEVGVPFEIILPFTEDNGVGSLQHVSVYFMREGDETIYDSQTGITYEPNSPVEYTDSLDFISDVTAEGVIKSAHKIDVTFGMTFNFPTEEGESLDAIVRSWDKFRRSSDIRFNNFLQVIEPTSSLPIDTSSDGTSEWSKSVESTAIKSTTVFKEEFDGTLTTYDTEEGQSVTNNFKIPKWIKYNAHWWAEDEISEDDFVDGMKYLIDHDVMIVPQKHRISILEPMPEVVIPDWVKNNASWWADDLVTDQEFVKAIEWLIEKGVITV